MKKILSLILAVILLAGIGIAVRASSITEDTPEATQSVQAVYQTEGETPAVIRVDIAWTGMSFTYNGPSQPQWDAENHKYVSSEGHWSPSNAAITITNHSNAIIQADIGYRALDAFSDTSMFFTDHSPVIGSADTSKTGSGEPCSVTIEAIPGGTLSDKATSVTSIGTVTVRVGTDLGSDPHITAFEKIFKDHEKLMQAGHDPQNMERGTVYIRSVEDAEKLLAAMDTLSDQICGTQFEQADRNKALNELIAMFYGALAIKQ